MGRIDKHQKQIGFLIILTLQVLVLGCSSVHQAPPEDSPFDLKKQILELQKVQSQQSSQIEDLNNKIAMLSSTEKPPAKEVIVPQASQVPSVKTVNIRPLAPVPAPIDIQSQKATRDPASKLYYQVMVDCKKPKLDDAQASVALMVKRFKDSPLTSNALYLYADTLFDKGNYAKSADEFERLYKLFPDGNKAVSALYKLALCYQKLGHPAEAQQAFENIVTLYPGSREALDSEKQVMSNGQENSQ